SRLANNAFTQLIERVHAVRAKLEAKVVDTRRAGHAHAVDRKARLLQLRAVREKAERQPTSRRAPPRQVQEHLPQQGLPVSALQDAHPLPESLARAISVGVRQPRSRSTQCPARFRFPSFSQPTTTPRRCRSRRTGGTCSTAPTEKGKSPLTWRVEC